MVMLRVVMIEDRLFVEGGMLSAIVEPSIQYSSIGTHFQRSFGTIISCYCRDDNFIDDDLIVIYSKDIQMNEDSMIS